MIIFGLLSALISWILGGTTSSLATVGVVAVLIVVRIAFVRLYKKRGCQKHDTFTK